MGRPRREEYQGGIYHVIARGNNKECIFKESIEKATLLYQTIKGKQWWDELRIFGYVLMDNHYHIIIQTMNNKLQEIMHQNNNNTVNILMPSTSRWGMFFNGDTR